MGTMPVMSAKCKSYAHQEKFLGMALNIPEHPYTYGRQEHHSR